MKIECGYCGQHWEIYQRDDLHGTHARQCPHCDSKIDRDTWLSKVIPAFSLAAAANEKLYQDHVESHKPIFTVGFIPDHIFE